MSSKINSKVFEVVVLFKITIIFTPFTFAVSWELASIPAVFGKDVQLKCNLTTDASCCDSYTRKWSAGKNFDLLIMNGASSDELKYTELLNTTTKTSILNIANFSLEDINIPYECTYGFNTASRLLGITEDTFEFYPTEDIPENFSIEDKFLKLNISFDKIYPSLNCTASDGNTDISANLTVLSKKNGLLYMSSVSFYYNIEGSCHQTVFVRCTLRKTSLITISRYIDCREDATESGLIALAIVSVVIVAIVIVGMFWCYRKRSRSRKYETRKREREQEEQEEKEEEEEELI